MGGGGQSNANYAASDGAYAALATIVGFYTGAASAGSNYVYADDGIGLDNLTTPDGSGNYTGSFVNNADAATTLAFYNNTRFGYASAAAANIVTLAAERASAGVGGAGAAYASVVSGLGSGVLANTKVLVMYWLETDSLQFTEVSAPLFKADVIRWMQLARAMYGETAAELPCVWIAPPYGLFPNLVTGPPACREALAAVMQDPAQNMLWLSQTYDTVSRNETVTSTGLATGGNTDGGHRAAYDNVALFRRAGVAVARAILAANGGSLPAGLGTGLGPAITGVTIAGSVLTVTVTHDAGNDLVVPLLASQGVGFSVMDGGSTAAPGAIIQATACARIDATHLRITLASAPTSGAGNRRLMYPWAGTCWTAQPDAEIGRGCAVTDNFASVAKPAGYDANASLFQATGTPQWAPNMPLQIPMTMTGSGSTASASYGLVF